MLVACLFAGTLTSSLAQERCATTQYNQLLQRRNPAIQQSREELERHLRRSTQSGARITDGTVVRIPVVVHVVHHNPSKLIGGANNSNISDEQIYSQIQVLNEDYRRIAGTSGFNDQEVGADTEIEFYLASCDKDGKATSGITRTYNATPEFGVYEDSLKKIIHWPSDQYLNIWVADLAGDYLGYAQFPDMTGLEGLNDENGTGETDGVIIDHNNFGRRIGTAVSGSYQDGRTATHEIGHWLGLLHIWGDDNCGNDYCEDTPPAEGSNSSKSCQDIFSFCSNAKTRNMIENYLDYSPDKCMNIFTQDQKTRMHKVLETSPRRKQMLLNSCELPQFRKLSVTFFPNPALRGNTITMKVNQSVNLTIYDVMGRFLYSKDYTESKSQRIELAEVNLPKGMYLVRVTSLDNQTIVQRLAVVSR